MPWRPRHPARLSGWLPFGTPSSHVLARPQGCGSPSLLGGWGEALGTGAVCAAVTLCQGGRFTMPTLLPASGLNSQAHTWGVGGGT